MTPKVATIVVARDEEQFIERHVCFHLDMGFSTVAVLDHCSTDGTSDILEQMRRRLGIVVVRDDEPSFDHARLSNRLLAHVLRTYDVAWVMPLDADEFFFAPGGVARFIEWASEAGIAYGAVPWVSALWAESDQATFGASPFLTEWFYRPWPERTWQHAGHFRKAICRVHPSIEIVVGGHYFRREANADFFATRLEPAVIPFDRARIFHYEFRESVDGLFAKWAKLAQYERDSSSAADAPWMERLDTIKEYVREWQLNRDDVMRFWSAEPRTFWGTTIPQPSWEHSPELARWHASFVPRFDHLMRGPKR